MDDLGERIIAALGKHRERSEQIEHRYTLSSEAQILLSIDRAIHLFMELYMQTSNDATQEITDIGTILTNVGTAVDGLGKHIVSLETAIRESSGRFVPASVSTALDALKAQAAKLAGAIAGEDPDPTAGDTPAAAGNTPAA